MLTDALDEAVTDIITCMARPSLQSAGTLRQTNMLVAFRYMTPACPPPSIHLRLHACPPKAQSQILVPRFSQDVKKIQAETRSSYALPFCVTFGACIMPLTPPFPPTSR